MTHWLPSSFSVGWVLALAGNLLVLAAGGFKFWKSYKELINKRYAAALRDLSLVCLALALVSAFPYGELSRGERINPTSLDVFLCLAIVFFFIGAAVCWTVKAIAERCSMLALDTFALLAIAGLVALVASGNGFLALMALAAAVGVYKGAKATKHKPAISFGEYRAKGVCDTSTTGRLTSPKYSFLSQDSADHGEMWNGTVSSVNIDGSPMVGSVDIHGNPYGVTNSPFSLAETGNNLLGDAAAFNVDGSPMMGAVDIHGHPYGVTET